MGTLWAPRAGGPGDGHFRGENEECEHGSLLVGTEGRRHKRYRRDRAGKKRSGKRARNRCLAAGRAFVNQGTDADAHGDACDGAFDVDQDDDDDFIDSSNFTACLSEPVSSPNKTPVGLRTGRQSRSLPMCWSDAPPAATLSVLPGRNDFQVRGNHRASID